MTTKIGSVYLEIEAKMTKLEADLAKANRTLSRFDKDARGIGGRIEGAFKKIDGAAGIAMKSLAGFAAGIGVGLLQGGAKAILDFADNLGTAAQQANVSIERFQSLKGAFRSLEIDAATFEKILQKLIVAQGEVASGAKNETTKALDELGISAKILSGEITTTDQMVDALAKSLGEIQDPAQKAAIAADLVSKRYGTQLAAALGDGGKALKQAEQDFRDAGKTIDTEMVQKLAAANERWDSFTEAVQAKSVILAADVLTAFEAIGNAAGSLWDKYWAAQASFVLDNAWLYDEKTLQGARDELIRQNREMLDQIEADQKRTAIRLASVNLAGLEWIGGGGRTKPKPRAEAGNGRTTGPTKPTFSPADLRMGNDLPPVDLPISLDVDKPLIDLDKLNVGFDGLKQRIGATDIALAEVFDAELVERMAYVREQGINTIGDALEDLAFEGGKNIDDLAKWFVRLAIRMEVIEPLLDTLRAKSEALAAAGQGGGGILGTLFKLGSSLIGGGGPDTAFTATLGDRVNDYTGRGFASGGRPPLGGLSLVGERGPELFQPDVAGRIIPNDVLQGVTERLRPPAGRWFESVRDVPKDAHMDVLSESEGRGWRYWAGNGVVSGRRRRSGRSSPRWG